MFGKNPIQTWVVMNDLQIPFQDKPILSNVLSFVSELRPYGVILNGDVVDCYAISDFTKDPANSGADLGEEIRQSRQLMARLATCTTQRIWLGGNHEDRLRRYMWKNAPAVATLENETFEVKFKLADYGVQWKPYGGYHMLGKLMVTHGDIVSKHSAYSARMNFEKYGSSILVGHTHRLGIYYKTDVRGSHAAYENGCLCRLDPEYVQHPNWQRGFSVVHVDTRTGFYNVNQIPILDKGIFYYGSTRIGKETK